MIGANCGLKAVARAAVGQIGAGEARCVQRRRVVVVAVVSGGEAALGVQARSELQPAGLAVKTDVLSDPTREELDEQIPLAAQRIGVVGGVGIGGRHTVGLNQLDRGVVEIINRCAGIALGFQCRDVDDRADELPQVERACRLRGLPYPVVACREPIECVPSLRVGCRRILQGIAGSRLKDRFAVVLEELNRRSGTGRASSDDARDRGQIGREQSAAFQRLEPQVPAARKPRLGSAPALSE